MPDRILDDICHQRKCIRKLRLPSGSHKDFPDLCIYVANPNNKAHSAASEIQVVLLLSGQ
jgi:hypothetical protein